MTTAIAARVRFYSDGVDHKLWQNFWHDQTVEGFTYLNFSTTDILLNRSADEGGITLRLPPLMEHVDLISQAIEGEYLAEVRLYESSVTSALPASFGDMEQVARFTGEVQKMRVTFTDITVDLGAGIDAVNGEIPGRRMTTSLIGRLPTL